MKSQLALTTSMLRLVVPAFILVLLLAPAHAQVYSNRDNIVIDKDSAAAREYHYVLPILGKKAAKAGFDLPYSAGLGINYLWQKSDLVIDNLQVGFNHQPMFNLDEIVRFDKAISEAQGLNFRPDVWLLPFLNVYGILAKAKPTTTVGFGVWVPDEAGNWTQAMSYETTAEFEATTFGFGITPTVGLKGAWLALDMNMTWSDIDQLAEPAFAFIFGPRLGKTFKLAKPQSNLAFWVGGFRLKLNTGTTGSLQLSEVVDLTGLQAKVDNGQQVVVDKQTQVDAWWNGLSSIEQKNPGNIVKHETANRAIDRAGQLLGSIDNSLNDEEFATVQYSLDKRPKDMWNFVIGSQYQINKHWMIRLEYGFLTSRQQVIGGLQFRFGL